MRTRLGIALLGALAALAAVVAAAAARPTLHDRPTPAGAAFPQRTWILSLPAGRAAPAVGRSTVTENGHGVVGLNVAPAGASRARARARCS